VAADTTGRLDRLFKFAEIGVFDVLLSTRDTATLEVLADRLAALDTFDRQLPAEIGLVETRSPRTCGTTVRWRAHHRRWEFIGTP